MKRLTWYGLTLALVSLAFAWNVRADDDKKPDKDKVAAEDKKFEGTWVVTKMEVNGQKVPEEGFSNMTFTFTGKKYVQKNGEELMEAGTQDLDPTKKPKHMDIKVTEGETEGKTQLAIYEIEGDKMTIVAARHGETERPTKMEAKDGTGQMLFEMKKKK